MADDAAVPRLRFQHCDAPPLGWEQLPPDRSAGLRLSCGTLRVPLDHGRPDGEQLSLAVVRVRSSAQGTRIGSVVLNPGGPGQPGLGHLAGWAGSFSDAVLARFDLVTFDPRGTGASGAVDCGGPAQDELLFHDDLLDDAAYAAAAAIVRHGTARCLRRLKDRASSYGTQATARDLDLLRAALGDRRLTYVGFSYGARLGGEYARQFPRRVRALVLDAPPDPVADPVALAEDRLAGFEESLAAWAADCPRRPTCAGFGADPLGVLSDLVSRAHAEPVVSRRPAADPAANAGHIMLAAQVLLYTPDSWPVLDEVVLDTVGGDSGGVFEVLEHAFGRDTVADGAPDPLDAGFVIECTDRRPGPSEAEIRAAAVPLADRLPFFGRWRADQLFGCAFWTADRHPVGPPVTPAASRLLVVGTVGDPATPYAGVQRFAQAAGDARLLTWDGEGHTAYGRSACIGEWVDAFLLRRTLPPPGTRCPA